MEHKEAPHTSPPDRDLLFAEEIEIPSDDGEMLRELQDLLHVRLKHVGLPANLGNMQVALVEALVNARKHGNDEDSLPEEQKSPEAIRLKRKVILQTRVRRAAPSIEPSGLVTEDGPPKLEVKNDKIILEFFVSDEGKGFNPLSVADPRDAENLSKDSGRGLLLMRAFMDKVHVVPIPDGTVVLMRKKFQRDKMQGLL